MSVFAHNKDITGSHWLSTRRLCPMAKLERQLAPSLGSGRQERTEDVFRRWHSFYRSLWPVILGKFARSWVLSCDCTFIRACCEFSLGAEELGSLGFSVEDAYDPWHVLLISGQLCGHIRSFRNSFSLLRYELGSRTSPNETVKPIC